MDSPIRKALKRNDYLRHKLFRKIKRRQKARNELELKLAEKELKKKLRRPRFDLGSDDETYWVADPKYRDNNSVAGKPGQIVSADYNTNTAVWKDAKTGRKRTILLPDDYWMASSIPDLLGLPVDQGEITQGRQSQAGAARIHRKLYLVSNKDLQDPLLGAYARFADSWDNNTNPVRAIAEHPATQAAIMEAAYAKGLLTIGKFGSPYADYKKLASMNLKQLDEFFTAHPQLITQNAKAKEFADKYINFVRNNIKPRYKEALRRESLKYTPQMDEAIMNTPEVLSADFGPYSKWGGYYENGGNRIVLNSNPKASDSQVFGRIAHEKHHAYRNNLGQILKFYPNQDIQMGINLSMGNVARSGYTPGEMNALEAYLFTPEFIGARSGLRAIQEKGATNSEIVARMSHDLNLTGEELDKAIQTMPKSALIKYLDTNAYGRNFLKGKWTKEKEKAIRNALSTIASVPPFLAADSFVNRDSGYDGGKDKYYLKDPSILAEMVVTPDRTYYETTENGTPAVTFGALKDIGDIPIYENKELLQYVNRNSLTQDRDNSHRRLALYLQKSIIGDGDIFSPWGFTNLLIGESISALPSQVADKLALLRYVSPSYYLDRFGGLSDEQITNGQGKIFGTGNGFLLDLLAGKGILKITGKYISPVTQNIANKAISKSVNTKFGSNVFGRLLGTEYKRKLMLDFIERRYNDLDLSTDEYNNAKLIIENADIQHGAESVVPIGDGTYRFRFPRTYFGQDNNFGYAHEIGHALFNDKKPYLLLNNKYEYSRLVDNDPIRNWNEYLADLFAARHLNSYKDALKYNLIFNKFSDGTKDLISRLKNAPEFFSLPLTWSDVRLKTKFPATDAIEFPYFEMLSKRPSVNLLDDIVKENPSALKYHNEGGESTVYTVRNSGDVIKDNFGVLNIDNLDILHRDIIENLQKNRLPGMVPLQYLGILVENSPTFYNTLKDGKKVIKLLPPSFGSRWRQLMITPMEKIKLWAYENIDDVIKRELNNLGYKETEVPGIYKAPGVLWKVGDLGPNNVGFDVFGNFRIFDPMWHYKNGKDIHIKLSKRGTFTAAAKRHGMGVQEYARKVLKAPKGKYSSTMHKKANFARNAKKWNKK